MRLLIIFFLLSLFSSCKTNEEKNKYNGQWEALKSNKLNALITINNDSVAIYKAYYTKCDTFFTLRNELNFLKPSLTDDTLKIPFLIENDTLYFIIHISTTNEIELCSKNGKNCYTLKKSSYNLKYNWDADKKLRLTLSNQINDYDTEYKRLKKITTLGNEATTILQNIDSIKIELMKQYGLEYSSITCWHKVDSLPAHTTPSLFMIGKDPAAPKDEYLSGYHLEKMLHQYLYSKSKEIDVSIIFSEYNNGSIDILYEGIADPWSVSKFYHMPLGNTILELNRTQVRIVQLEKIIQLND